MLNQEQQQRLKDLYQHPDWQFVKQSFMEYLEPMIDIRNIDHKGTALSVKGEIKAKIDLYNNAIKFFDNADLALQITEEDNNSME